MDSHNEQLMTGVTTPVRFWGARIRPAAGIEPKDLLSAFDIALREGSVMDMPTEGATKYCLVQLPAALSDALELGFELRMSCTQLGEILILNNEGGEHG